MQKTKLCCGCKIEKLVSEFIRHSNGKVYYQCKECQKILNRNRYQKNKWKNGSNFKGGWNPNIDLGLAILLSVTKGEKQISDQVISYYCQCTSQSIGFTARNALKKLKKRINLSKLLQE